MKVKIKGSTRRHMKLRTKWRKLAVAWHTVFVKDRSRGWPSSSVRPSKATCKINQYFGRRATAVLSAITRRAFA